MKKYFLLFLLSVFAISCSKKVEVKGKITGGSPLERIEFIEASGVATLPLTNIGLDKDGNFSGNFEAPKNGMYVISYAGRENLIYLKQGQSVNISGKSDTFPSEYKVEGDAKANNDFLLQTQKFMNTYTSKLNMQQTIMKDEAGFLKDIKKIQADLEKNINETGAKTGADKNVIEWKKNDIRTGILTILPQFEMYKKQSSGNPSFAVSKNFKDYENSLQGDKDHLVKNHPIYRSYLLGKMSENFQTYAAAKSKQNPSAITSEFFSSFLKEKKDISQTAKDYLLAFVVSQSDVLPNSSKETIAKVTKIVDEEIKDSNIKSDLKKLQFAINGLKINEKAPDATLTTIDGKSFKIADNKARPRVLMFYTSWTPYIKDSTLPVLSEVVNFYKSKVDFIFINFDDTKEQFQKTHNALLKNISGTGVYAEGGLNSDFAKKYGIYGFKMTPSFLVLDKEGKVAGRSFFNLGDPELVALLDKVSGLKAPEVNASLQNDLLAPQNGHDATAHEKPQAPEAALPANK